MRNSVAVMAAAMLLSAPAIAEDRCVYETGLGPSLTVVGSREAIVVDFGDWSETCPIVADPSPRPDLGFGGGWSPSLLAKCDNWSAQLAFVEPVHDSNDFSIVVFDGKAFYRERC